MSEYAAETDIEEEEYLPPATQLSDHVPALSQGDIHTYVCVWDIVNFIFILDNPKFKIC